MKPICRLRALASCLSSSVVRSWPSSNTLPELGRSSVPMMFSNVLLPEPDGPMIAADSPLARSSVIFRNTSTGGALSSGSYRLLTSMSFKSGSVAMPYLCADLSGQEQEKFRPSNFRRPRTNPKCLSSLLFTNAFLDRHDMKRVDHIHRIVIADYHDNIPPNRQVFRVSHGKI